MYPSEETKRKISLSLKGRVKSEEHRQNISLALKGRYLPEEVRAKISLALKGRHISEEHKRKISLTEKGKINVGRTPWMKGRHHFKEVKEKLSKIHKGKHYSPKTEFKPGHKCSEETLEKIGRTLKGRKFSEEHKQKIRATRLKQVLPQKDTSIEVKMQNELSRRGIAFKKHLPVCGICQPDIVLPENKILIFCDGVYWHNLLEMKNKDRLQDKILRENGWKVYRFWGNEINKNVSACVNTIVGVIGC